MTYKKTDHSQLVYIYISIVLDWVPRRELENIIPKILHRMVHIPSKNII